MRTKRTNFYSTTWGGEAAARTAASDFAALNGLGGEGYCNAYMFGVLIGFYVEVTYTS
jgi:hypothetical protein